MSVFVSCPPPPSLHRLFQAMKAREGGGGGGGGEEVIETVVYQWTTAVPLKLLKALKGGHDSSALAGRDLVGLVFAEL